MNRIQTAFHKAKTEKRIAVSAFLTAGYPSLSATKELVLKLEQAGVDFFEIGFPFSDPVADGPTIQRSSEAALKKGVDWNDLISLAESIRKKSQVPLIFMGYANTLFCRGWEKSAEELGTAGFDGAIIPDMIPEESGQLKEVFEQNDLSLVHLLAPTSSDERIQTVCEQSSGFVYCVSVTGVTGARRALPFDNIRPFLKKVKEASDIPVILGFGISQPEQLRHLKGLVDGVVIGSALIQVLEKNSGLKQQIGHALRFIRPFVQAKK